MSTTVAVLSFVVIFSAILIPCYLYYRADRERFIAESVIRSLMNPNSWHSTSRQDNLSEPYIARPTFDPIQGQKLRPSWWIHGPGLERSPAYLGEDESLAKNVRNLMNLAYETSKKEKS